MRVLVSAWAIGRDAGSVGGRDAGEFRPERFFIVNANGMLSNNVDVKGQDRELLPFWVGSQDVLCRGVELQDLSMEEKEPLQAIPEPKLSDHLYSGSGP
ncbi:hypothetical protein SORBI_3006G223001 [Sorghum bicolor]|uniref:Uncharacterized protein n=1 Tax=Sorghum bicolor TaxID=4558 RepID=A0A1Z5RG94_SORBI|nr:hypothetical protein SORBI_3006G223001 [Sorghum bicolor]